MNSNGCNTLRPKRNENVKSEEISTQQQQQRKERTLLYRRQTALPCMLSDGNDGEEINTICLRELRNHVQLNLFHSVL